MNTYTQNLKRELAVGLVLGLADYSAAGNIDFNIDGGRVVPTEPFAAKVTVLGSAIVSGD